MIRRATTGYRQQSNSDLRDTKAEASVVPYKRNFRSDNQPGESADGVKWGRSPDAKAGS